MKDRNIGKIFGELEVIERAHPHRPQYYLCRCTCGKEGNYYTNNLARGKPTHCGCKKERGGLTTEKDGTRPRLYRIYMNMLSRCHNDNVPNYPQYGGNGIKVCDEWRNSYKSFQAWALANDYNDELTIDRIDNSKGYSPDNCRWATAKEQSRNRDYAWFVEIGGVTKHAKDWCAEYGIEYKTAHTRKSRGMSDIAAVTTPLQRRKRK